MIRCRRAHHQNFLIHPIETPHAPTVFCVMAVVSAFTFSDGRDANDIRLSFGYQSQVSRQLSDSVKSLNTRRLSMPVLFFQRSSR